MQQLDGSDAVRAQAADGAQVPLGRGEHGGETAEPLHGAGSGTESASASEHERQQVGEQGARPAGSAEAVRLGCGGSQRTTWPSAKPAGGPSIIAGGTRGS